MIVLLHQRAAEVVDAPAQRLGGGVEAHLHPARLQARDAAAEREAERRGVLEVLLARDLLDPVGAAEQRVERDEGERHELGEAARALLQLAHDAHVLGQLPRLLDVPEHHRDRRAQAGAVAASMISTQRADGQLVRADPLAHAVVQHLRRGAGGRAQPGVAQAREHLATAAGRRRRTCARPPSGCRRAGAAAARPRARAAASPGSPRAPSRDGCRTGCTARSRRRRRPRGSRSANSSRSCS